jgi:hypothetical protein
MTDRLFFSLAALAAIVMIGLALAWPQGLGARSLGPFGHETEAQRIIRTAPKPAPAKASLANLKGGL